VPARHTRLHGPNGRQHLNPSSPFAENKHVEAMFDAMFALVAAAPWGGPKEQRKPVAPHPAHRVAAITLAVLGVITGILGLGAARFAFTFLEDDFLMFLGLILLPFAIAAAVMAIAFAVWMFIVAWRVANADAAMRWYLALVGFLAAFIGVFIASVGFALAGIAVLVPAAVLLVVPWIPDAWRAADAPDSIPLEGL
jgi:hypothetical protein